MSEHNPVRIAEDENGARSDYEDIQVGKDLGTLDWIISREDIEKQCRIDEDYDPAFCLGSDSESIVAPPQIQYRPPRWLLSRNYNVRGVFYRWDFENLGAMKPDVPITVTGKITDKWIARGREYVAFESSGTDPDGKLVFTTQRTHVLDIVTREAPRDGRGLDSGVKKEKL